MADNLKGYILPVTVNVTRQDGQYGEATKAAYNETSKKLEFSTGDKLLINGFYNTDKRFVGRLSYVSDGKFRGTISTETEWPGTADDLLKAGQDIQAYLFPAGYESYGFLSIEEAADPLYDDCTYDYSKAFALTKAAGVEHLSREYASSYSGGFALAPRNAILYFTIIGLSASTEVAVVFSYSSTTVSKNVTTDASGNATFAIGVPAGVPAGSTDFKDCSLTVGGDTITLANDSSDTLAAGWIYNITGTITVTWDSSNVFNVAHKDDAITPTPDSPDDLTYEGITLSRNGAYPFFMAYDLSGKGVLDVLFADESFSFTAPSGKKFTQIEIINNDNQIGVADDKWSLQGYKAIWTGTPSNTVTIGSGDGMSYFDNLNSIVFTLCY